jgi:hypothetical protein
LSSRARLEAERIGGDFFPAIFVFSSSRGSKRLVAAKLLRYKGNTADTLVVAEHVSHVGITHTLRTARISQAFDVILPKFVIVSMLCARPWLRMSFLCVHFGAHALLVRFLIKTMGVMAVFISDNTFDIRWFDNCFASSKLAL